MTLEFDLQPTLIGARITARPLRAADWHGLFAAAADKRIWEQHPANDRYTEPVFREYFDSALASGSALAFEDRAMDRIIGSSRYHGLDRDRSEIEIGWTFLARDYWGGSYNREIKVLMLEHAFRFVDVVVFWVGESNWRSRRAMEKLGARLRGGVHRRAIGGDHANVVYEMPRSVWQQLQNGP